MIRFKSSWLSRTWQRKVFTKSHHVWKPNIEIWKFKWTLVIFPWLCWWETWCFHSCLLPPPNKVCLCGELSKIDCCDVFHPGRAIYETLWNNIRSNKDCTKKHLPYDREAFSMFPMFPVFSSDDRWPNPNISRAQGLDECHQRRMFLLKSPQFLRFGKFPTRLEGPNAHTGNELKIILRLRLCDEDAATTLH